jgi:hypothetical protein
MTRPARRPVPSTLDNLSSVTERKSILLRLDPAVHDALARWANDELRSTNAQIEFLLRRALADAGRLPGHVDPRQAPSASRTASAQAFPPHPDTHITVCEKRP